MYGSSQPITLPAAGRGAQQVAEPLLGGEVVLHVAVEVQVVAGQIGPHGDIEPEAGDALHHQPGGGHLHDGDGAAALLQLGEQRRQLGRLEGGVGRGLPASGQAEPQRPEDPRDLPGGDGDRRHQVAGGALAVGAGDAHHLEPLVGPTGQLPGGQGHAAAGGVAAEPGQIAAGVAVGQHRHRTARDGLVKVLKTVVAQAGQGGEEVARADRLGAVGDCGDLHVGSPGGCTRSGGTVHASSCGLDLVGRHAEERDEPGRNPPEGRQRPRRWPSRWPSARQRRRR